jgi:1,4-alpha-glucan branching enzyme
MRIGTLIWVLSGVLWAAWSPAWGAEQDNNVEWDGVSHIEWADRRPLCPVGGESFEVRFQTYRGDLTAARVLVDGSVWVDASVIASRGPYDVWMAAVPETAADTLGYIIELTDGTDTDYLSRHGMSDGMPSGGAFELDFVTLEHAPLGATPVTGGVVFKVWSPNRSSVHVRGQFNGWGLSDPMTKVGEHFIRFVEGARPGQQYKYFFNNGHWNTDPRARRLNPTDNLNAYVVDPLAYRWRTEGFSPPAAEDLVIYQLHVGSFAGRNDPYGNAGNPSTFRDVAARADHLAALGVNAVMLNPINEFPGDFSGGYNPISMWAVEWKLGAPDDLKFMVDELHARGIAVLLDIVWNHFSPTDNFLWNYDGTQLYFGTPAVETPWGPQADFGREGVRSYFLDSVVLMLEEYRFDGFRADGTDYMNIGVNEASGWSLMQALNELVDRRYADKTIIAEQLPDDPWVTRPVSLGGAGFDAQYHDAYKHGLRSAVFEAAFGDPDMGRLAGALGGSGPYMSGAQVLNYFELHDEAWGMSGGERAVKTIDPNPPHDDEYARGRTKLAQGLTAMGPGIPAVLMGTEWLEDAEFEQEKIDWSKRDTYADILAFYRDLLALRVGNTALRASSPYGLFHLNEAGNVLAFQRYNLDGLVYAVAANFSNTDYGAYRIGLPQAGRWAEVLNSQWTAYGGHGLDNPGGIETESVPYDGFAQSAEIRLPRAGLVVLQWDPDCAADFNGDGVVDTRDVLSFLNAWSAGEAEADFNGDGTIDTRDVLAFLNAWSEGC